jgi:hypothetical protein
LSADQQKVLRLAADFVWICPGAMGRSPICPTASNGKQCVMPTGHTFDPLCDCTACLAKRGTTIQYVHLIPNLPDGSAGIYTEGDGPADAMQKHLHELKLIRLGDGKGRKGLRREAEAARQTAEAILSVGTAPPSASPRASLGPNEFTVLQVLARESPCRVLLADLAAKAEIAQKTCGKIVNALIKRRPPLAERESERTGATITPAGEELLKAEKPAKSPLIAP